MMAAEQVFNLNSDIQQLRAQAKQAKAIVDKVDQVMRMSHRKDPKQKENLIKFLKLSKQLTLAELGYYKNHLEDIKKISPKTAQRFEKSINTYERTSKVILMDVIPYLEQVDTTRINAKQMVRFVDELENALKRQAAQSKNLELFCYLINDFLNDIIGVGYSIFANTYDPNTMKFQNQELFDQMMSQNPKMIANWMETMMQDAQFHNQTMDYMAKNPEQMNQWMLDDPKHVVEMATAMRENHDFMMAMMSVMMNDPALRLQIQGHMTENPESIEQMKKTMVQSKDEIEKKAKELTEERKKVEKLEAEMQESKQKLEVEMLAGKQKLEAERQRFEEKRRESERIEAERLAERKRLEKERKKDESLAAEKLEAEMQESKQKLETEMLAGKQKLEAERQRFEEKRKEVNRIRNTLDNIIKNIHEIIPINSSGFE